MTRWDSNLNNPLVYMNKLLIILILFFGIKGAIFSSDTFLDLAISLFLYAVFCFINGIKGIQSKTAKLEIVGDLFVGVVLIMTCGYFVLLYLLNTFSGVDF